MSQMSRVLGVTRALLGISKYAMAERVGLSRPHYRDLEAGDITPGPNALGKVSKVMGMSVEALKLMCLNVPKELDNEHVELLRKVQNHLMTKFVTSEVIQGGIDK